MCVEVNAQKRRTWTKRQETSFQQPGPRFSLKVERAWELGHNDRSVSQRTATPSIEGRIKSHFSAISSTLDTSPIKVGSISSGLKYFLTNMPAGRKCGGIGCPVDSRDTGKGFCQTREG